MNKLDPKETAKHVEMIEHPENWPVWPVLPLKSQDGKWNVAVIYETPQHCKPNGFVRVYETNLFLGITSETPYTDYPNATAVIEAGWKVD